MLATGHRCEKIGQLWADDIASKYPKFWTALTAGTIKVLSIAADGEPRNGKMVRFMEKMPQFRGVRYELDKAHFLNTGIGNLYI